ncbi:SUKH-4 family immunity protein [Kitasatospora sp. NA04385]|uniref:SUKH-4 family immunity protein n=1 Tax=Kitasatospora sp. NA04385 TaxID=2742135 RepID=UPI001591AFD4|nr:SUKH-4 family immunity protein [Kitasatospora sp. NA04385]QKW23356.1 SUKH-4 family immunity protein [Kitasatospora sp. NA04385]
MSERAQEPEQGVDGSPDGNGRAGASVPDTVRNAAQDAAQDAVRNAVRDAVRDATDWLRETGPGLLYVCGAAGSGKTSVLAALAERFPEALLVDTAGRSGDAVARGLIEGAGVRSRGAQLDFGGLVRALRKERKPRVVLLANPQLAGSLASGGERELLRWMVRWLSIGASEGRLRLVVEQDRVPVFADPEPTRYRRTVLTLPGGGAAAELRAFEAAVPAGARAALVALACAEHHRVPVEGWAALCRAAGVTDVADGQLASWAEELPWLVADGTGVGFASPALAGALREAAGDLTALHGRMTDALLGAAGTAALPEWAARALPGHAAAAGRFDALLADARALARIPQDALLEGVRGGYPDGVAPGTDAAALHHLGGYGLAGVPHGHWVAHLALDAFTRGRPERARLLAESCPEPLLFHPVWADWRPPGDYDRLPATRHESDLENLTAVEVDGRPAVLLEDERGVRFVRDAGTGEVLAGPLPGDAEPDTGPDAGLRTAPGAALVLRQKWHRSEVHDADGKPLGVFHHPEAGYAVAVGGLVVLADSRGAYAVELDAGLLRAGPEQRLVPVIGGPGRVLPRPFDPAAVADLAGLLARAFGPGQVHRLRADELPAGVVHGPTRRLLTEVGVPSVPDLVGLCLEPTGPDAFAPHPWESVPENEQPAGSGPFLSLGRWMGARLLLDGATGRVLRMLPAGSPDHAHPRAPLAGSSLGSFLTMVALQQHYLAVYRTGGPDRHGVLGELELRLAGVDPGAAGADCWQYVSEPFNW